MLLHPGCSCCCIYSTNAGAEVDDHGHAVLAIAVPAVALFAFQRGYAVHRDTAPMKWGILGVLLVITGAVAGASLGSSGELAVTMAGSLILTSAHVANRRLVGRCAGSCCPDAGPQAVIAG